MIALLLLARLAAAQAPADAAAPPAPVATEAPAPDAATAAPDAATATPDATPAATPSLAIDPAEIVGAPAGPPLSGEALRAKTHEVAKLMRCPVCQGLSVADSPSESALAMKKEVEDLVARGYDGEQILLYFEASYGEFIRLEPKFEGVNVLVWAAPVLLLVGGLGFVAWSVRSGKARGAASATPTSDTTPSGATPSGSDAAASPSLPSDSAAPPDEALAAYLRKVREETR